MFSCLVTLLTLSPVESSRWMKERYCDYNQLMIDESQMEARTDPKDECQNFCTYTAKYASQINLGDSLCCDFEEWTDGTYNCYLFQGNSTVRMSHIDEMGSF